MAKCPKCGAEVDRLVNRVAEVHYYDLMVVGDNPEYEEQNWEPIGHGDYQCPECNEVLFREEDEAIALLKG